MKHSMFINQASMGWKCQEDKYSTNKQRFAQDICLEHVLEIFEQKLMSVGPNKSGGLEKFQKLLSGGN